MRPDQLTSVYSPPRVSSAQLQNGVVGQAYSAFLQSLAGRPTRWRIVNGVLPAGLTLNETSGEIFGTPTATNPGTPFVVEALNFGGVEYETLSVAVDAACTLPSISIITLAYGRIGTFFVVQLGGTGSGPFTWSVSAGALPPGLALNPANGIVSGYPTKSGSFAVTVRAQNGCGAGTQAGQIVIGDQLGIQFAE